MLRTIKRPSPAMVVALLALSLAVGGGHAVADGVTSAVKAVSGKNIKKNSIEADRLTKKARKALTGSTGPIGSAGPAGPQGPAGAAGATGAKGDTGTVDTSNFYDKATSDVRFLGITDKAADSDRLDGLTAATFARHGTWFLTLHPVLWQAKEDALNVGRFTNSISFGRTGAGSSTVLLPITLPNAANGRRMAIQDVRYCYSTGGSATIASATLYVARHTASASGADIMHKSEALAASDDACRHLTPDTPFELAPTDSAALSVDGTWTGSVSDTLELGTVTVALQPTAAAAGALP